MQHRAVAGYHRKFSRTNEAHQPAAAPHHNRLLLLNKRLNRACLGASAALILWACAPQLAAIGGDNNPAQARASASQLLTSLAERVTDPVRDATYDTARFAIARSAFLPSRAWNDSAVWTESSGVQHVLSVTGRFDGSRYRFDAVRALAPVAQLADLRHTIRLTRLSGDEYAWDTDVSFAIGSLPASAGGALLSAILAVADGRDDASLRADYRAFLPRATAIAGELFTLDSVRTLGFADGSAAATVALTLHPDGLRQRFPKYSAYLERYVTNARMHWTVLDRAGASYLQFGLDNGQLVLRTRSRAGTLLALNGPARAMPDTLVLAGEMTARIHHFTVGFRDYHADLVVTRGAHERAISVVTRREPDWVLPFITERLLRAPLARPFRGNGSLYRVGLRDDTTGGQTLLTRRMHLEVQESAILRFIGRLGWTAVSEYDHDVEQQGDAWLRSLFAAMASDVGGQAAASGSGE